MKIEIGKKYLTRCGNKVRIYAIDGASLGNHNPIHGAFLLEGEDFPLGWVASTWTLEGKAVCYSDHNLNDIVAELSDT